MGHVKLVIGTEKGYEKPFEMLVKKMQETPELLNGTEMTLVDCFDEGICKTPKRFLRWMNDECKSTHCDDCKFTFNCQHEKEALKEEHSSLQLKKCQESNACLSIAQTFHKNLKTLTWKTSFKVGARCVAHKIGFIDTIHILDAFARVSLYL